MFVFIHIPKTAGTSFLSQMNNLFGDNCTYRLTNSDYESGLNVIETRLTPNQHECNFFSGHIPYSLLNYRSQDLYFYTLLRDPINRVESLYRFYKTLPSDHVKGMGLESNFTFDDFINSNAPELYTQINNGMSRQLARSKEFFDPFSKLFRSENAFDVAYEDALDFISTQNFGLIERFADSNIILTKIFELKFPLDTCKDNITNSASFYLNAEQRDVILSKNKYDMDLYQRALVIFESRLLDMSSLSTVKKIPKFTYFQPVFNKTYSVADIPSRQGFYDFESDGFAWLREDVITRIYMEFTQSTPFKLILTFYSIIVFYPLRAIDLYINEEKMCFDIIYNDRCKNIFDLIISVGSISCKKDIDLIIEPNLYFDLKSLGVDTKENRKLSLALCSLRRTSA